MTAIDHGTDHGANVSVYLADREGNGIELYYDRPRADWFDAGGRPILKAEPFDPNDLLHAQLGNSLNASWFSVLMWRRTIASRRSFIDGPPWQPIGRSVPVSTLAVDTTAALMNHFRARSPDF